MVKNIILVQFQIKIINDIFNYFYLKKIYLFNILQLNYYIIK